MILNGADEIRRAFSCFATGVAIATTVGAGREPVGMTINSFSSVSLDPPLVLWSVAKDAKSFEVFSKTKHFALHVLGAHQKQLSTRFATRGVDKFAGIELGKGIKENPLLPDFAACFECSTEHRYPGGDHMIIVGRVLRFEDHEVEPLIFHRSKFRRNGSLPEPDRDITRRSGNAAAITGSATLSRLRIED